MGRYEELLERAEGGDASAFKALKEEFGGSALRTKAEEADGLRKQLDDNEGLIREAKFRRLADGLDLDVELSLGDLEGVSSADLTEDLLREKAEAKSTSMKAMRATMASDAGYDSVEEYDTALASLKKERTNTKTSQESIGGATSSSSGGTPHSEEEKTVYEKSTADFNTAKKQGATDDIALGEAAHTMMAAQAPVDIGN